MINAIQFLPQHHWEWMFMSDMAFILFIIYFCHVICDVDLIGGSISFAGERSHWPLKEPGSP